MKNLLVLFSFVCCTIVAKAQSANSINGQWINPEKDGKIEMYEQAGKFYAKLVWLKSPNEADGKTPRKDRNNKDANLRDRTLVDIVLFSNFVFKDGKWVNGEIYDPKSGRSYSGQMTLKGDRLEVRGYIGSPAFGKTLIFLRK